MGNVREYDFTTAIETSTTPDPGTPSADSDTITKGFADGEYARRDSWYDSQSGVSGIKAIAAADRADGQLVWAKDLDVFYEFRSGSSSTGDDDNVLTPDAGSGRWHKVEVGGTSTSGSSITTLPRGELINQNDAVYMHEKPYIEITSSNQWIDINEGAGELNAQVATGTYLFDTDENIDELESAIKTALDAAGTLTYTVTFSQSTRKFTISAGSNFSLLWKTGTHGSDNTDDHIGTQLGYSDAADDTSASSHEADNTIEDQLSTQYFWFACDADYYSKSKSYWGIDTSGGAKFTTATVRKDAPISNFSLSDLGDVFTASAAIVITSGSNDDIDFDEGAGELTATITAGTYQHPYNTLVDEIKTQMDSAGTDTYTISYDNDTDKFTIASDGSFSLDWNTGTNTATTAGAILGFDTSSDSATAASHESDNVVGLKGQLVFNDSSKKTVASVNAGVAIESDKVFAKRKANEFYLNSNTNAADWLADPSTEEKDFGSDITSLGTHENSAGYGVRVVAESGTSGSEVWNIQYKTGPGAAWQDASTTIQVSDSTLGFSDHSSNTYKYLAKCFVDENNKGVIALGVWDNSNFSGNHAIYAYYSNDLDTWTKATGPDTNGALDGNGANNVLAHDIWIREGKCVILTNEAGNCLIHISDDSGSGYTSFSQTALTNDFNADYPAFVRIQYFPNESGAAKHRIVCIGRDAGGSNSSQLVYFLGDGSSETAITDAFSTNAEFPLSASMDRRGTGNRISCFAIRSSTTFPIYQGETNEDYNSGTLTINNHTSHDISNNPANGHDIYNGFTSANANHLTLNRNQRSILIGSAAYLLVCQNNSQTLYLSYTTNITGGSWSQLTLRTGGASDFTQEYCMEYLAAINKIVVLFKKSDARANNVTKGQIFAAFLNLASDGTPTLEDDFAQIDGGESLASFQGFLQISASTNGLTASWEHYDGSTRDDLWTNRLI